jgi:CRISPR-associated protein Csd2
MFEHDRSAARGEMTSRRLIVFKHDSALGNAKAQDLFERVKVQRMIDGEPHPIDRRLDNFPPARHFTDYVVEIDRSDMPDGVHILEPA